MTTLATQARKSVKIAGKTYYYTQPDVHTYKFEFEDGRYIGQISYIRGTGREKDYWLPGTSGVHSPYWGEACALLLQEYWEQQATQAAPPAPVVERAPEPEPSKQEEPLTPQEEWITPQEAAARLKQWGQQSVTIRVRAGFFQARQVAWGKRHHWELLWPGLEAAQAIMRRSVPAEIWGPSAVARQRKVRTNGASASVAAAAVPLPDPPAPKANGHHEPAPAPEPPPPPPAVVEAAKQAVTGAIMRPDSPLQTGLLKQLEQLHAARVEDARTIGRLTMQIEILEQRLAECQASKPQPRKWWQV